MTTSKEFSEFKKKVRAALGNYVKSEGCSCCQDKPEHKKAAKELGKLLNVSKYEDGSGYDFYKYANYNES